MEESHCHRTGSRPHQWRRWRWRRWGRKVWDVDRSVVVHRLDMDTRRASACRRPHEPSTSPTPSPRNNNLLHRRHRNPSPTARSYTNTVTPHLAFGPLPGGRAKPQDPQLCHSTGWEGASIWGDIHPPLKCPPLNNTGAGDGATLITVLLFGRCGGWKRGELAQWCAWFCCGCGELKEIMLGA